MNRVDKSVGITCRFTRNGQESRHSQGSSPGNGVDIHPERHPGNDHNQNGGNIGLHHMETNGPRKMKLGHQAAIVACN